MLTPLKLVRPAGWDVDALLVHRRTGHEIPAAAPVIGHGRAEVRTITDRAATRPLVREVATVSASPRIRRANGVADGETEVNDRYAFAA